LIIARNKKDDEAYTKRGHAAMLLGNYDLALTDCTHAIELDPGCGARAYDERSKVYERLGKHSLAEIDRGKAKALNAREQ
jgi:tetratricopeptide (TPR) repeat protein